MNSAYANRILVYYDEVTGETLLTRMYGEYCAIPPDEQEQDFAEYPELRNGEGIGRIFRYLTQEEKDAGWRDVRVDTTKDPHEIVFEGGE
jgi:hypothetical protein